MKESARYILQILVFVAIILSIGTCGYMLIEDDIKVGDAFYMAVTSITPTQFDEVHKLSIAGRYFTVALVFCGFGAVVAFATQFARLMIQSELEGVGVITRRQMQRRISRMKNHYIICGYGEIGGAICSELKDHQLPFVVIANDDDSVTAITREGFPLVRGNPTADAVLKDAEVERAVAVIAILPDDADNLFISLAVRELNPQIFIIARGEEPSVEHRILRAGADIVVSPMKLGGRQIASLIKQQANISAAHDRSSTSHKVLGLGLSIYRHATDEPTSIADVLKKTEAVGIAGIHRQSGQFEPTPSHTASVQRDDAVVVITRSDEERSAFHKRSTGKSILIADDHRALRLLYSRKLASAGHKVIQAATGDEALTLARERSPDLIVLDVNMPNRNGYEVCAALRNQPDFATIPIILYSGDETDQFIQLGKTAGASRCVRKTSKSSELLACIEEAFIANRQETAFSESSETKHLSGRELLADKKSLDGVFNYDTAVENADGDQALVDELIEAIQEDTPRILQRLQQVVGTNDLPGVNRETHTLKSSVAIFGAELTAAIAAEMEQAATAGDLDTVQTLFPKLQHEAAKLMEALENFQRQRRDHLANPI